MTDIVRNMKVLATNGHEGQFRKGPEYLLCLFERVGAIKHAEAIAAEWETVRTECDRVG